MRPLLPALCAALLALVPAPAGAQGPEARSEASHPGEGGGAAVVRIPAGSYRPFFRTPDESDSVGIGSFALDARPVTVAEYLAFVREVPRWQRGEAPTQLAGKGYLSRWDEALRPGPGLNAAEPVTEVSWFAARAYCRWAGGRLPTTNEWEWAASRVGPDSDLLALYQGRPLPGALPSAGTTDRSLDGVRDLHGLVWEWTDDFNNQTVTGAGRDDQGLDRQLFCAAGAATATDPSDYAGFLRWGYRSSLTGSSTGPRLGFRCAY